MSNQQIKSDSLLGYADALVENLRELLPKAVRDSDPTSIHHSRVATRRLKAAVDVFKPISTRSHRRELEKSLKKLRRHLGPARDMDVMLGHLQELKSARLEAAVGWITEQITERQRAFEQSDATAFDVAKALARLGSWWGVREEWTEAVDEISGLVSQSLHVQLERFIEHADAVAGRGEPTTDEQLKDPHQLRIAGKALRYTLEMAIAGGHRFPTAVARSFKPMQDALGLWHDYVVLMDRVLELSLESMLGHHDALLAASVLDVAKLAAKRSQKQLLRFNRLWTEKGPMLASTIRQAFPLAVHAAEISETETDRDPPGLESTVDPAAEAAAPGAFSAA
jgi:CHAD domain-containing protein